MVLNILMNYILVYVVYNVSSMRENKNKNLTFSISFFVFVDDYQMLCKSNVYKLYINWGTRIINIDYFIFYNIQILKTYKCNYV